MGLSETTKNILDKVQAISDAKESIYATLKEYASDYEYDENAISGNFEHFNQILNDYLEIANTQKKQTAEYLHRLDNSMPESINMSQLLPTIEKYVNKIQSGKDEPNYIKFIEGTTNTLFIPKGTTTIRSELLNSNELIQYIEWDNELKEISLQDYAFKDSNIINLTIPRAVTSCGQSICNALESLQEVTWSATLNSLPAFSFQECKNLEKFTCDSNLTKIETMAFYNCTNLSEAIFPDTLETLDNQCFYNCKLITNFTFNEGLKTIGFGVFSNTGLNEVKLPKSLQKIYGQAFLGTPISTVDFGENIEYFEDKIFCKCQNLKYIDLKNKITLIPSETFLDCIELEEVKIPDNILRIGPSAFENCTKLSKITNSQGKNIFNNLTTIDKEAFRNTALFEFYFNNNLTTINDYAFSSCKFETIIIPETVTYLGDYVFHNNPIKTATIETDFLGTHLFSNCPQLTSVIFKNENPITSIPEGCFGQCTLLNEIDFSNISFIGNGAFYNCKNLQDVTLPKIETLDNYAFDAATIDTLTLGENFTKCNYNAFYYANINRVNFLGTAAQWSQVTFGTTEMSNPLSRTNSSLYVKGDNGDFVLLTNFTDSTITTVKAYSFYRATSLVYLGLENVTNIYAYAFYNCSNLDTIKLPHVKTIAARAFYGCSKLSTAELGGPGNPVTSIGQYAFSSAPTGSQIYVWTEGGKSLSNRPWGAPANSIVLLDSNNPNAKEEYEQQQGGTV